MVEKCVSLRHDHIRQVTFQCIATQITCVLGPPGILCNIVPVVCHLHPEVSGTAMYCQPTLAGDTILAVLNKMVAASKCSEALIEYTFLQFDSPAEISDEPRIDTRGFVYQFRGGGACFQVLRIEKAE